VYRGNRDFKSLDRFSAAPGVIFSTEPMGFETTVIWHHVLKAEMSEPIQLKQFV